MNDLLYCKLSEGLEPRNRFTSSPAVNTIQSINFTREIVFVFYVLGIVRGIYFIENSMKEEFKNSINVSRV